MGLFCCFVFSQTMSNKNFLFRHLGKFQLTCPSAMNKGIHPSPQGWGSCKQQLQCTKPTGPFLSTCPAQVLSDAEGLKSGQRLTALPPASADPALPLVPYLCFFSHPMCQSVTCQSLSGQRAYEDEQTALPSFKGSKSPGDSREPP